LSTIETNLTTFYICYLARHVTEVFVYVWLTTAKIIHCLTIHCARYSNDQILNTLYTNDEILKNKNLLSIAAI